MLKLFNRRKKDNKGFTLVELVIVVAILAILVGILAPQYTKYVEKSRQSADVSNLENIVKGFKVAAADTDYNIIPNGSSATATFTIKMESTGTTITADGAPEKAAGGNDSNLYWEDAIKEYTGYDFSGTNHKVEAIKLKSKKWRTTVQSGTGDTAIQAIVTVKSDGSVTVVYNPESVKDGTAGPASA